MYKKFFLIIVFCLCCLCACSPKGGVDPVSTEHQHVPDNADCLHEQFCVTCGEQLAEQGAHAYPDVPVEQADTYSVYLCRICGQTKIINQDGLPVVPVE